jgi:hypothetical protein
VQPDHHIVITKVNEVGISILGFALFCQYPLLNSSGWMGIQSELLRWLPSVSCIFYVGGKEQRAKIYAQEVCAMKFNVMVTTYEFIMRDRAKLSKVEWKYMIIDEAQRMKDRESRLARDLDRFSCQRRLLLTGTPLQVLFSSEGTLFCVRNCVFLIVIYTPFPFTLA